MEINIVKFFNHLKIGKADLLVLVLNSVVFLACLWISIVGVVFIFDRVNGMRVLLGIAIAFALHFIISEGMIKHSLKFTFRKRPFLGFPDAIVSIGKKYHDSSFPSSHMASTLSVLTVLFFFYEKFWPLMVIFVLLAAFSRIRSGMHYLSDILAGVFFGIFYGHLATLILIKYAL